MLATFWEETSVYYTIFIVMIAIGCVTVTFFFNKKNKKTITEDPPTQQSDEPTIDSVKFLRDPILLAKELEDKFPKEVKLLEKKVKNEQIEAIYKLMQKHSDQFGDTTMDDMKNQMQLYGF